MEPERKAVVLDRDAIDATLDGVKSRWDHGDAPYNADIEPTYVGDLPEPDRRYPVIVEETRRYVVWVDADNPEEAVESFNEEPYDPGYEAMYHFDWTATAPDEDEWWHIGRRGDGGWGGLQADAHILSQRSARWAADRAAKTAACATAGHPAPADRRVWPDWCEVCGRIEPGARTAEVRTQTVVDVELPEVISA